MNILLVLGLVLFASAIVWIYFLFVTSSNNDKEQPADSIPMYENPLDRCAKLFDQGLHAELQRYAQRELTKNYGDIELRRILAKSFMVSGNEKMGIMHYEAILSINSHDIQTQEMLAQYYFENGPKSRAIKMYEQILSCDLGNITAAETLAKLYDEVQNYEKAVQMYQTLLDAEVDEGRIKELKYTIADLYIKLGDNEKAFDFYREISAADPDNLEILILLADLGYKNKYWKDCLNYYQRIIAIVGDDFEILEKIAQMHVFLEDWPSAISAYQKIISLEDESNPNYLYHQNELCTALLKNKEYHKAIDLLKDLLAKNPSETSFVFTLAQAYTQMGEFQKGINLYQKLLDTLSVEQSEIIINHISNLICAWAQDLFKKGEYNQAFDKFFEALKYNEENDDVYFQLGKCNYYIKSFQDAIAHFKRAITIKPQESLYYFGLGCAYDEMGSYKNAKVAFYDAININPMNVQARIAYAISLTKELEYAQSIEQFLEVLKYVPNDADTLYNLALAYDLVGDMERAIKFYKKALDVDKKHKEAKHNLELILEEPYIIDSDDDEEEENQDLEQQEEEPEFTGPIVQTVEEPAIEEFSAEESVQEDQNELIADEDNELQQQTQDEPPADPAIEELGSIDDFLFGDENSDNGGMGSMFS